MNTLIDCLKEHEGFKPYAYPDSLGYLTIGYGRMIDHRKNGAISQSEGQYLLENDINNAEMELRHFTWYTQLDNTVRQEALVELNFNMGLPNLLKFTQMIAAIEEKDYNAAAMHLLNSLWAREVKEGRADNVAHRLQTGSYA
jgi:lysozyme